MLSLLSAVSKILLHFLSQNSSVAARTSERAAEHSETMFGQGRAEETWSLGARQVRSITSSHLVLLQYFTFRNALLLHFSFGTFSKTD